MQKMKEYDDCYYNENDNDVVFATEINGTQIRTGKRIYKKDDAGKFYFLGLYNEKDDCVYYTYEA